MFSDYLLKTEPSEYSFTDFRGDGVPFGTAGFSLLHADF